MAKSAVLFVSGAGAQTLPSNISAALHSSAITAATLVSHWTMLRLNVN